MSRLDAMKGAGDGAWSFAKHVMGGAAIGGAVNTAAYASGGSLTNSQSAGQAFMSGAGWGAAIGGGFGVGGYKRAMAASAHAKASGAKAGAKYSGERGEAAGRKAASKVKGMFKSSGQTGHAQNDMATTTINYDSPAYMRRGIRPNANPMPSKDTTSAYISREVNRLKSMGGGRSLEDIGAKRQNYLAQKNKHSIAFGSPQVDNVGLQLQPKAGPEPFSYSGGISFDQTPKAQAYELSNSKLGFESNRSMEARLNREAARGRRGY